MDWVAQHRFRNWLIVVLLVSNLLTVSIIWMQTTRTNEPRPKEQDSRGSESIQLLRKALDLTEEQTRQFEKIRLEQLEQSKGFNDRLSVAKKQLAEVLFANKPDTALANLKAKEIGDLQSSVELTRFRHFHELLAICTPEQKEKLKPILVEVFGRQPPKDEMKLGSQPDNRRREDVARDRSQGEARTEEPNDRKDDRPQDQREDQLRDRRNDRPAPPPVDEKLSKYAERLNLSDDQSKAIRIVLQTSERKGEQLRMKPSPNRDEIETEKERIRKEEDASIMRILNEEQKREFEKMILNRRK
jgi:Spy/CpxP family protein refolding chaperone